MKLITEQITDVAVLKEGDGESKQLYIEGIFLQADLKNRNGRVYPGHIMEREVNRYMKENVDKKIAYGELGHPTGPTINPDRISHRIVSIVKEGSNYIGKALISNTPMGNIAKSLIEGGGGLAVSSRGIGSLKRNGNLMEVQDDFMLATAADIVINPSAPDAYVQGILENVDYFYENGLLKERTIEHQVDEAVRTRSFDETTILKALNTLVNSLK